MSFASHMDLALSLAAEAAAAGEVPVGAVISDGPRVVATARNRMREHHDPTAHAEIAAIRAACATLKTERLTGLTLTVTLEPCPMCAAAISNARLARLIYAASDPKSGGVAHGPRIFTHPQCHHVPDVIDGIQTQAAEAQLKRFFAALRSSSL
ncbi:nucleoside deaminase [Pseudaestuariivita atlantica]|uniref:tRNA-specific adenosine deaminase n=1 Tax=Pseudaestuariivita atlantica TaxID=1317121 RepID=A0A0L1JQV9_9RHOB|nr:nucleoside deaminase [Pseudaestuariivita atlantica]KNG94121.1 CMP deaminase [Pseudaestuariivita atlantica]